MREEIDRRAIATAGEGPYALFQAYRLLDGLHWTLHREGKAAFDAHVASSNDDLDRIRRLV
jgi:hypothetical protein